MAVVVGVDAGTTGVRALAVDERGSPVTGAYRELTQHYPRPGWVEHDPVEIWEKVRSALASVAGELAGAGQAVAAVGVANQRETVVAWDRRHGAPRHRAIVWQDRRTADRCRELEEGGHLPLVRARTGLVLDPYFSATKAEWLLHSGGVAPGPDLVLGTVDSWVLWNLTGGPDGGVLATDPSNASRTLLYDIVERRWSEELCQLFGVPAGALAEVRPTSGRLGLTGAGLAGDLPGGVPVSGLAGDQAAALFGQACLSPGMAKATYGTGTFVLVNVGPSPPPPAEGLLTSVAWDLAGAPAPARGADGGLAYALEGSIFATGSAIQWLADGLGIIAGAAEIGPLAASVPDSGGAVVVPAFNGLGSPWWDPWARGAVVGLTRGVGRAQLARAVLEAMAYQTRDVVDAMAAAGGAPLACLRVDGGASVVDLLLQLLADQLGVPVTRPRATETTALGAAFLAGLAEGVWASLEEVASCWAVDVEATPTTSRAGTRSGHATWLRALERSRGWAGGRRAQPATKDAPPSGPPGTT